MRKAEKTSDGEEKKPRLSTPDGPTTQRAGPRRASKSAQLTEPVHKTESEVKLEDLDSEQVGEQTVGIEASENLNSPVIQPRSEDQPAAVDDQQPQQYVTAEAEAEQPAEPAADPPQQGGNNNQDPFILVSGFAFIVRGGGGGGGG